MSANPPFAIHNIKAHGTALAVGLVELGIWAVIGVLRRLIEHPR